MKYNEEHIINLLRIEKKIVEPPAKEYKEDRGHYKKNFTLQSLDSNYVFRGFIRYNSKFQENFTVGLDYNPREEKGTICLLRLNGPHGENRQIPHHDSFHIHRATADTINSGLKPESNIEISEDYASIDQAIQYFCNRINLNKKDWETYFPKKQLNIFDNG